MKPLREQKKNSEKALNLEKQKYLTNEMMKFLNDTLDEETLYLTNTSFFIPSLNENDNEVYYKVVISQVMKNFEDLYDKNEEYHEKKKER